MKKYVSIIVAIAAVLIIIATVSIFSLRKAMPTTPLAGHEQLVLVVSRTEMASAGKIIMYDRSGEAWQYKNTGPAVIGRNGMAWPRPWYAAGPGSCLCPTAPGRPSLRYRVGF